MLKSWKTRAMATAGAVALAAPFAFMGGATAQTTPTPPTGVTVSSASGDFTPGSVINVSGSGCNAVGTTAQTAGIRLRGPGATGGVVQSGTAAVLPGGSFQGTLTVPTGARVGDTFTAVAFCTLNGTNSTETAGTPVVTVAMGSILGGTGGTTLGGLAGTGGTTLSGLAGTGSTSLSGSSITSTSGQTSSTGGFGTTGDLSGGTTGIAQPITATPRFTG